MGRRGHIGGRRAGYDTYAPESPFVRRIPASPVLDSNSATWVGYMGLASNQADCYEFGVAVYTTVPGDPTYTVLAANSPAWGPEPFGSYNPIPIPSTAAPATGSDGWMVIRDPARGVHYELWQAVKSGSTWSCTFGGVYPMPGYNTAADAKSGVGIGAGTSITAGVVTRAEMAALVSLTNAQIAAADPPIIAHAVSFNSSMSGNTFRYPATKTDGSNPSGVATPIPEGTCFQLNPSVDLTAISGITKFEVAVGRALQVYGCVNVDTGGPAGSKQNGFYFEAQDLTDPARSAPTLPGDNTRAGGLYPSVGLGWDYYVMDKIPWSSLRALAQWSGT